jgi:hypothetical protein
MIEGNEITHTITGDFLANDEVAILVPTMKGILKEGTYDSYLEVLVDDRVFIPLELKINFEESVKVVAEAVERKSKKNVKASASLVSSTNILKSKVKENLKTEHKLVHPAKQRRDKKIIEVKNQNKKDTKFTEQDIIELVRKIRQKTN